MIEGARFDTSHVTAGQAHAGQWCLKPVETSGFRRMHEFPQRRGVKCRIRVETPTQRLDREWENVDGCSLCRYLPNPTSNNSTVDCACDGDLGSAEVVVGGTHKTCRNYCPLWYEGVEGHGGKDVNACVLWGDNEASFLGIGHHNVASTWAPAPVVLRARRRMASRLVESRCVA